MFRDGQFFLTVADQYVQHIWELNLEDTTLLDICELCALQLIDRYYVNLRLKSRGYYNNIFVNFGCSNNK